MAMQERDYKTVRDTNYLQEFRKSVWESVKYFNYPIHYKETIKDYVIYRGQGWQQHAALKTFVIIPGSAYLHFNPRNADCLATGLLRELPSDHQVIFTPFPAAPEHRFPTPVLHLQKSLIQLIEFHDQYRIDVERMALGGYSCGGTMAIPLAIYFAGLSFFFRSVVGLSPIYDYTGDLFAKADLNSKWASFERRDHKNFNNDFIRFLNYNYSSSRQDLYHPWYSPYLTPAQDLSKLKNISFIYGEFDYMRRTVEAFKEKLTQARVPSESIILNGEGHAAFLLLKIKGEIYDPYPEAMIPQMKLQLFRQVAKYIRKVLV